jgi:DNA-binding NarL/FixJ family response regulator
MAARPHEMTKPRDTETVVLLEPSPFWLEAVSGIVEEVGFSRILSADTAKQALALIEQNRPSLFLYGLAESPDDSAWGAYLATVHARFPELKIIVLSTVEDEDAIAMALRSGAAGYVLRRAAPDDLRSAVRQALTPTVYHAGPAVSAGPTAAAGSLTRREIEVLALVAEGHSNAEIAESLGISEVTVKGHLWRIYRRIGAKNRADAVTRARAGGLLPDPSNPRRSPNPQKRSMTP